MHNFVRITAAAALCALTCACAGGGAEVDFVSKEYESGGCEAEMRIVQFGGAGDFCRAQNERWEQCAQETLDEFLRRGEGADEAKLELDSRVAANNGALVSVVAEGEAYTGGAHGEKFRICRTVDLAAGREFSLDDIFADAGWRDFADARMKELAESGAEEYADLWERPSAEQLGADCFYIKGNKIVFWFPPYALSYYRKGFVEFEFALKDFVGYLSDDFKIAAKI